MKTIVTTAGRPTEHTRKLARETADILQYPYVERKKRSVNKLQLLHDCAVIVAGNERFELYRKGMEKPFFFHPNSAAFRLKRLLKGGEDPLLDVSELTKGDSFLDCTLGLASDSIIASHMCGEFGKVTGIEIDRNVAFITEKGLRSFQSSSEPLTSAMRRVQVVSCDAVRFLEAERSNSWDVVYIDPMFHAPIAESNNFTPLRKVGTTGSLTAEWVEEAYRVCKRSVVIKDHFESPVFKAFGFKQIIRPNTKFHFGVLAK